MELGSQAPWYPGDRMRRYLGIKHICIKHVCVASSARPCSLSPSASHDSFKQDFCFSLSSLARRSVKRKFFEKGCVAKEDVSVFNRVESLIHIVQDRTMVLHSTLASTSCHAPCYQLEKVQTSHSMVHFCHIRPSHIKVKPMMSTRVGLGEVNLPSHGSSSRLLCNVTMCNQ